MGNSCCKEVYEGSEAFNDSFINPIKDFNIKQDTCFDEIKTVEYITTRANEKPLYNPILPIRGDFAFDIEIPPNEIYEVVKADQNELEVKTEPMLRYPTNFKIEPAHFRKECTKESFICRYSAGETIGKGSFGVVKKIQDLETGIYRAVKIISKENCQRTDNFADEIEIIKKLVICFK